MLRCASLLFSRSTAALATASWVQALPPLKRTFCILHYTGRLVVRMGVLTIWVGIEVGFGRNRKCEAMVMI